MNDIELLSPAGDYDSFCAAINAGATAVYFGLNQFNARSRAKNISFEQLDFLVKLAKSYNVKTYLTLNILIKDCEFDDMVELTSKALSKGIDAVIVQDVGIVYVLQKMFPDVEIHASTQMTTHNISQCRFLSKMKNVKQINLSRELSLKELFPLVSFLNQCGIKSEVFVHGAFCISYSGQCYLSNALCGEAGNRGSCVQPCRRKYNCATHKGIAPFNLKDNSAYPYADELVKMGVSSLKIEGRIKGAEYVWAVTSAWKKQLDAVKRGEECQKESDYLSRSMNRGFTSYLEGNISKNMFTDSLKDHSLEKTGEVITYNADGKELVVSFFEDEFLEEGDEVTILDENMAFVATGIIKRSLGKKQTQGAKRKSLSEGFDFAITNKIAQKIKRGHLVLRQSKVISKQKLQDIIKNMKPSLKKMNIKIEGSLGEKLKCTFEHLKSVTVYSDSVLAKSEKNSITEETLRETVTKFGGTDYVLGSMDVSGLEENLFLPLKELKKIRRNAVSVFESEKAFSEPVLSLSDLSFKGNDSAVSDTVYLCSTKEQAIEKMSMNEKVLLEIPLFIEKETEDFLLENKDVIPYFSSIMFDDFLESAKFLLKKLSEKNDLRTVFCQNTGLAYEASMLGLKVIGGSFFNASNSFSIKYYKDLLNLSGIVPSLEIDVDDVAKLKKPAGLELWYPLYEQNVLMQSRQCLTSNLSSCQRENTDESCIANCSKEIDFSTEKNEKLKAIKRKGFYSAIYSHKPIDNHYCFEKLKTTVNHWIVDIRF